MRPASSPDRCLSRSFRKSLATRAAIRGFPSTSLSPGAPLAWARTGAMARYSAARGDSARHARARLRHAPGSAKGRIAMSVPSAMPVCTASRGSSATPRPPATIWTRVYRLVAANSSDGSPSPAGPGLIMPQAIRVCSRRQCPSSSSSRRSAARLATGTASRSASAWSGGRAARNMSRANTADSAPAQSQGSATIATSSVPARSRSISRSVVSSRRSSRSRGKAARIAGIMRGSRKGLTVGIMPMRSVPLIGARAASAASSIADSAAMAVRDRATISRPKAVKATRLPLLRSRICASNCRSSAKMPAESVDWVTAQALAARPKCWCSARASR